MNSSILKKLLKRYTSGSASKAERYLVDIWYSSFVEMGDRVQGLETEELATETKNRILGKITPRIQKPVKIEYIRPAIRIAASLLLVTTVALWFYSNKQAKTSKPLIYQTIKGQIKKITLSDSTQIWLNSNTSLEVLPRYGKDYRKVRLSGEAYFQVAHRPDKPFIITSGELQTQVLGTSFNISAYPTLNNIEIDVNTGKVSVSKGNQALATLMPGKAIQFNKVTQQLVFMESYSRASMNWRNGRVMLDDASFDEMALKFSNMFNVTLYSNDDKIKQLHFRLMIDRSLSMKENLKIITGIHQLKFRKTNENAIEIYLR